MLAPIENIYHPLKISSIRQERPGIKTFFFETLDGSVLQYEAGQFLTFVFSHHHKKERRSFSISGSPALGEPLSITVKRIDNGIFTRYLIDDAKPGDIVYSTGAAGLFTIPADVAKYEQVFFFAAGIGIVPILSQLKELLHSNSNVNAVLIYSNRHQQDVVFYNELQDLLKKFADRFKIEFLYSAAFHLSRARLNKALAPQLINEYALTSRDKMLFYTCGPYEYMRMLILALEEYGINAEQVKKENFDVYIPVKKLEPPDKDAHTVTLKIKEQVYKFQSKYPDTILQSARKLKIDIPYSCEAGRCGSCIAHCSSGKVWMSVNEVLTDSDATKGLVLTCVAYPVDGDVELDI